MSAESVTQVETELGLTATDIDVLKGVRLIWQKLQQLRGKALKDDKAVRAYQDLLARGLAQARAQQAPVEDDQIALRCGEFWGWFNAQCAEHGVRDRESGRGLPMMAWSEKWLPTEYGAFERALGKIVDLPSPLNFETARAAATALLKAYVDAV